MKPAESVGNSASFHCTERAINPFRRFVNKKPWQKEIELMLKNGFKLEVEALISKDISYVSEEYVPGWRRESSSTSQGYGL